MSRGRERPLPGGSWTLAVACGALLLARAPAIGAGDVSEGGELYAEHCRVCHGGDGRGVAGVPDLTAGAALLRSDPRLFEIVGRGAGVMPGYEGVLRGEEIRNVIGYLRTLR